MKIQNKAPSKMNLNYKCNGCNADCCASALLGGSCAANGPDAYCEAGLFGVCCDADTRDGNDCKGGNIQDASEEQISNNQAYQNYLESEIGTNQALEVKEAAQALIDAAQNSNLEGYNNAYNNYVDEHNELDDSNQEKVNEWLRENYEDEDHQLESELEVN